MYQVRESTGQVLIDWVGHYNMLLRVKKRNLTPSALQLSTRVIIIGSECECEIELQEFIKNLQNGVTNYQNDYETGN